MTDPLACPDCGSLLTGYESCGDCVAGSMPLESMLALVRPANGLAEAGMGRRLALFAAVNAGILATLSILLGASPEALIWLPMVGSFTSIASLLVSKWLLKWRYGIRTIDPQALQNDREAALYQLVERLAKGAGLERVPEVGIYEADDCNAFATGPTRNRALIAFSSGIVERLEPDALAAVAAHEMAHVANGDMLTMALTQAVVNSVVLILTLPLHFVKWAAYIDDRVGPAGYWLAGLAQWVGTFVLTFLGSLVVKAFSRWREFRADAGAAALVGREPMIKALQALKGDGIPPSRRFKAHAALQINGSVAFLDWFSTHPSLDRRIAALKRHP